MGHRGDRAARVKQRGIFGKLEPLPVWWWGRYIAFAVLLVAFLIYREGVIWGWWD